MVDLRRPDNERAGKSVPGQWPSFHGVQILTGRRLSYFIFGCWIFVESSAARLPLAADEQTKFMSQIECSGKGVVEKLFPMTDLPIFYLTKSIDYRIN